MAEPHRHKYVERSRAEETIDHGPPLGVVRQYKILLVCGCGHTTIADMPADAVDQVYREHYGQ